MAQPKKYKYDIAISFAEEDRNIALLIRSAFESDKLEGKEFYYYASEQDQTWGYRLDKRLTEIYRDEAHYALIILSQHYLHKNYCQIELAAIKERVARQVSRYVFVLTIDETKPEDIGLPKDLAYKTWDYNIRSLVRVIEKILDTDAEFKPGQISTPQAKPLGELPKVKGKRKGMAVNFSLFIGIVASFITIIGTLPKQYRFWQATESTSFKGDTTGVHKVEENNEEPVVKPKPVNPPPPLFLRDIKISEKSDVAVFLNASNQSEKRELTSRLESELEAKGAVTHRSILNPAVISGSNFNQLMNGNTVVLDSYEPQQLLDYIIIGNVRTTAKETPSGLFWREIILEISILNLQKSLSDYQSFTGQATSGSHDNACKEAMEELLTNIQNELNYEF